MSNLQTYYHLKLDFQKVDQHTGGQWLIHSTKRHKVNQLQSLEDIIQCRQLQPVVNTFQLYCLPFTFVSAMFFTTEWMIAWF